MPGAPVKFGRKNGLNTNLESQVKLHRETFSWKSTEIWITITKQNKGTTIMKGSYQLGTVEILPPRRGRQAVEPEALSCCKAAVRKELTNTNVVHFNL